MYYEEYGTGTPLILLNGGMGSIADFSLCIPALSKHYHVIAPDVPGLAKSELSDTISYELLAEYVSKMIDKLRLDSVCIIGWRNGGNTVLILAAKRPDKIRKVLVSGANYKLSGFMFVDSNALKPVPLDYKPSAAMQKWIDESFQANKPYWIRL